MKNFAIALILAFACSSAMASELTLSGSGTSSSPYLVTSATDWNALATYITESGDSLLSKYVQLTSNIDFTDVSVIPLPVFSGDLDGNSKTISGYSYTATAKYPGALVTIAGPSASIHDMTIEGTFTSTASSQQYGGALVGTLFGKVSNITSAATVSAAAIYTSGLVGYAKGGTITGCTFSGTITSTMSHIAGIAGYASSATITNCVNTGYVSGAAYVAGIVADAIDYNTIANCYNRGTVSGSTTYASGICGFAKTSNTLTDCGNEGTVVCTYEATAAYSTYAAGVIAAAGYGTYTRCYNTGTVKAESEYGSAIAGVAYQIYYVSGGDYVFTDCYNTADLTAYRVIYGVVGAPNSTSLYRFTMEGCYNTGNLTATYSSTTINPVAGVLGRYPKGATVSNCWNSGNITNHNPVTGGVLGYCYSTSVTATYPITITGCYNTGTITADGYSAGGVVGQSITAYVTIDSCWNTGKVANSSYYTGGIVGQLKGSGSDVVSNCWNAGDISGTSLGVGGIVGYGFSADSIQTCFNVGAVTGDSTSVGGIAGYTAGVISDVYNTGSVSGVTGAAGIVGTSASGAAVTTAYSTGTVTGTASGIGNIAGDSNATLSGTYYLTESSAVDSDTASTGLTRAQLAALDLGTSWTAGDNYTYPRLSSVDVDAAKAYAVQVFPADGDSIGNITQNFYVGAIDGVAWTSSPSYVEVDGNNATFTSSYTGELVMTATCGDYQAATTLTVNGVTVGIGEVATDESRTVVGERFYTTSGSQVAEPADGGKAVYIVVKTYDDGTTQAVKEVR